MGSIFLAKGTQCKTGHSVRKRAFHRVNSARSVQRYFVFTAPRLILFGTLTAAEYLIHRKNVSPDKISCTDNTFLAFEGLKWNIKEDLLVLHRLENRKLVSFGSLISSFSLHIKWVCFCVSQHPR